MSNAPSLPAHPAMVMKSDYAERDSYLLLTAAGQAAWVADPGLATSFPSMREAARAAMRLPASLRAFGIPSAGKVAREQVH